MDRFASGDWLDRTILRLVAGTMAAVTLAAVATALLGRAGTIDPWGRPLGTDFTLLWTAGRMALEGHAAQVYDWQTLHAAERATHAGLDAGFFGWHYPPLFFLVATPLAALPYVPSLVLWQGATLLVLLLAVQRILPGRDALLAALGFPAVFVCLAHGQNAFLTAALFGGGLALLERRPWLAGLLLGCLAYKPNLGLLVPVALVAGGYWRSLAAGAAAAGCLMALSLILFGIEPWTAFRDTAHLTRTVVIEDGGTGWYKIQSVFSSVRSSGGSVPLAYAAQGAVAAGLAAVTAWLWRMQAPYRLRAATLLLGSFLATPYVLDYDLVLIGPAIAFAAAHGLAHGFRRWEKTALALAWFVPICTRHLDYFGGVPAGLLSVSAVFILVAGRALRSVAANRESQNAYRIPAKTLRPSPG